MEDSPKRARKTSVTKKPKADPMEEEDKTKYNPIEHPLLMSSKQIDLTTRRREKLLKSGIIRIYSHFCHR